MKYHPQLDEQWLRRVIAADPSILGLGELRLLDGDPFLTSKDRLDLLFSDLSGTTRYEAELQIGPTNSSHIIQTLEYWGRERQRHPRYEHVGVLIAEEVSPRFLDVISLFNDFFPLIALQMSAVDTGDGIGLQFTKIVDSMQLGMVTEVEMDLRRFQEQFELPH